MPRPRRPGHADEAGRGSAEGRSGDRRQDPHLPHPLPGAILFVAPFAWLISASFQPLERRSSQPAALDPDDPTLDGYKGFLDLGTSPRPSAQGTATGAGSPTAPSSPSRHGRSRPSSTPCAPTASPSASSRGATLIFVIFLGTMMVPGKVTLIPNYIIIQHIPFFGGNDWLGNGGHGWLDSYWGLILPGRSAPSASSCCASTCCRSPDDLLEAARIDGASEFRIFWRSCCRSAAGARRQRDLHVPGAPGRTSSGR